MTVADSTSYARVVVIAPETRVDLALPVDVPVVDLLPLVLDLVGERGDDRGQHGGWQLAQLGSGELPSDRTLRSLDVVDGSALQLRPREGAQAPPIFDDAIDAIASTVRSGMSRRSTNPAVGAAAVAVAMAVAAVALFYRGHSAVNTTVAVAAALVALGFGVAAARGPGERVVGSVTAASGLPFAFIVGLDVVPGDNARDGVLLAFAITLLYSLLALPALGTGAVVFISSAILAGFGTGAALVAVLADVSALYVAAGTAAVGVGAIAVLPWFVVRLARLPLPFIPTSVEEIRSDDDLDIARLTARARLADEYLDGGFIGCAAAVAAASTILVTDGGVFSVLTAATCTGALLLRTRTVAALVPRAAILAIVLGFGLFAGMGVVAFGAYESSTGLLVAAFAAAAFSLVISAVVPQLRVSPVTRRVVDFTEAGLLVAILPMAVGVMHLYSTLRHL